MLAQQVKFIYAIKYSQYSIGGPNAVQYATPVAQSRMQTRQLQLQQTFNEFSLIKIKSFKAVLMWQHIGMWALNVRFSCLLFPSTFHQQIVDLLTSVGYLLSYSLQCANTIYL